MTQTHSIEDGRMPGEEMAWRETARNLCNLAALPFEKWEIERGFAEVAALAGTTDDALCAQARFCKEGIDLVEGMFIQILYVSLDRMQKAASITAFSSVVETKGAKLAALLKKISKDIAVFRSNEGTKTANKVESVFQKWSVERRKELKATLQMLQQAALLFSVRIPPAVWVEINNQSGEPAMDDLSPGKILADLIGNEDESADEKPKCSRKMNHVPDKIKPFRKGGLYFESGCQFVRRLLKAVGRGRISRAHIQDELVNLSAKKQTDDIQRKIAAAKALLKLNDFLLQRAILTLRAAARKRILRNGDFG